MMESLEDPAECFKEIPGKIPKGNPGGIKEVMPAGIHARFPELKVMQLEVLKKTRR